MIHHRLGTTDAAVPETATAEPARDRALAGREAGRDAHMQHPDRRPLAPPLPMDALPHDDDNPAPIRHGSIFSPSHACTGSATSQAEPAKSRLDEPDGPPLRRWSDLGCRRSLARPVLPVWSWLRRSTGAVSGHLRGLVARHHVGGFRPLTVPLWASGPVLVPLRSSMTRSGQGAGFAGLAPAALPASLLGKLSTDYEAMLHKTNRPLC